MGEQPMHWKYFAVKNPIGPDYLGMAVTQGAGGEVVLYTVDGSGHLKTYLQVEEAQEAILEVIGAMHSFDNSYQEAQKKRDQWESVMDREAFMNLKSQEADPKWKEFLEKFEKDGEA